MSPSPPSARSASRKPARSPRPRARTSGRARASCASSSSATSGSTSSIPIRWSSRSGPSSPPSTTPSASSSKTEVDSVEIDRTGEYPRARGRRPAQARRLRHEDPEGVRRARLQHARVPEGDGAAGQRRRQRRGAALGAPVDRRAAAAQALLRHRGAEAALPAALRRRARSPASRSPRPTSAPTRRGWRPRAELSADGDAYILNGEKLWCTNGTIAKLLVVMARDPKTKKISAFVVETAWPGVKVEHRCHFMGLKALANAVISFTDVRVPRREPDRRRGQGPEDRAHHAQHRPAVDPGRLGRHPPSSVSRSAAAGPPSACSGARPVGKHEAIAHKLADMAATTFAMEAIDRARLPRWPTAAATTSASRRRRRSCGTPSAPGRSSTTRCRSAAAAATRPPHSLAARGETPIAVEQIMRDYRINRIFEGSSEIMHLFMAREAVDKHLEVAGDADRSREAGRATSSALPQSAASTPGGTRRAGWAGAAGRATPSSGRSPRTCASSSARRASSRARSSTA